MANLRLGRYFCSLPPLHVDPFSLENLGDRVLMPAFALLFGRYFHDVQEPRDSVRANPFAIHLLDGSDGTQFALVVDGFAADPPFAVGMPFVVVYVGLPLII